MACSSGNVRAAEKLRRMANVKRAAGSALGCSVRPAGSLSISKRPAAWRGDSDTISAVFACILTRGQMKVPNLQDN
jgi:hypothetical protein